MAGLSVACRLTLRRPPALRLSPLFRIPLPSGRTRHARPFSTIAPGPGTPPFRRPRLRPARITQLARQVQTARPVSPAALCPTARRTATSGLRWTLRTQPPLISPSPPPLRRIPAKPPVPATKRKPPVLPTPNRCLCPPRARAPRHHTAYAFPIRPPSLRSRRAPGPCHPLHCKPRQGICAVPTLKVTSARRGCSTSSPAPVAASAST